MHLTDITTHYFNFNYFNFNYFNFNYFNFNYFNFNYFFIPSNWSFIYTIKLLASLFFLIFIRAGLPRYRYDFLTKIGWNKFLLLTLLVLLINFTSLILF